MAERIISEYDLAGTIDPVKDLFLMEQFSSSSYKSINRNVLMGVTGQPADISSVQTITNKIIGNSNLVTLLDGSFTLQNNVDTTKRAIFSLSGITTATTRTYTLPNASSTLADLSTVQTFTNKSLTNPVITGGSVSNSTVSVNAISEFTPTNGVTIDGLNMKDGKLNTNNSVITSNITDAAVSPAKLVSGTGASWSWQTYTPSWTNLTAGNAVVTGRYTQIGKMVTVRLTIVLGNTSAVSGQVAFSLPVTAVALTETANVPYVGMANISDAGTAQYLAMLKFQSTTVVLLQLADDASPAVRTDTSISSTVPMNWTFNDSISTIFSYEAA